MTRFRSIGVILDLISPIAKRLALFAACCGVLTAVAPTAKRVAPSAQVMTYIHHAPESQTDIRYLYQWEVLETALEKTRPKWGDYRVLTSTVMTERREADEMKRATGKLNVMYLSTTPEFERSLIAVHIPVDKNLGGYCVLMIRDGEQKRFSNVRTVDDLRHFSFGLGLGWIDVPILKANGFHVITGSSYDGLFDMLAYRRFDVLLRASVEVLDEYQQYGKPNHLAIEDSIILYYKLPMYFWFPRTDEGRRQAARVEEGMRMMMADGTYDSIFRRYERWKIERLHLKTRRILEIDNPFVGPETPVKEARLWFDPRTFK
jgi:hypothetical protein